MSSCEAWMSAVNCWSDNIKLSRELSFIDISDIFRLWTNKRKETRNAVILQSLYRWWCFQVSMQICTGRLKEVCCCSRHPELECSTNIDIDLLKPRTIIWTTFQLFKCVFWFCFAKQLFLRVKRTGCECFVICYSSAVDSCLTNEKQVLFKLVKDFLLDAFENVKWCDCFYVSW